jgi:hypothetical protein
MCHTLTLTSINQMLLSQLHFGQWWETYKLPWFYVAKHKGAHEQVVCEKETRLHHKDTIPFASTKGFP